ncbi:hypothetical protein JHK84_051944 [Glycine max]|nr:hypothetical protein JHK84_051944 [Glycine max]
MEVAPLGNLRKYRLRCISGHVEIYFSPTHVVKISISSEKKNLPAGEFWLD